MPRTIHHSDHTHHRQGQEELCPLIDEFGASAQFIIAPNMQGYFVTVKSEFVTIPMISP